MVTTAINKQQFYEVDVENQTPIVLERAAHVFRPYARGVIKVKGTMLPQITSCVHLTVHSIVPLDASHRPIEVSAPIPLAPEGWEELELNELEELAVSHGVNLPDYRVQDAENEEEARELILTALSTEMMWFREYTPPEKPEQVDGNVVTGTDNEPLPINWEAYTVAQLKETAEANAVDLGDSTKKADIAGVVEDAYYDALADGEEFKLPYQPELVGPPESPQSDD